MTKANNPNGPQDALAANQTGENNTATGANALFSNTIGTYNTSSGSNSLYTNTSGTYNTAAGYTALFLNTTGTNNTATGAKALRANTFGVRNAGFGSLALCANTTGGYNTTVGYASGQGNTTGCCNVVVGYASGSALTTGDGNTIIGANISGSAGLANTLLIGAGGVAVYAVQGGSGNACIQNTSVFFPDPDNTISLGTGSKRWVAVYAVNGTIQTSDSREKTEVTESALGTDFVKALNPVSYKWIEGGNKWTGEYDENNNRTYETVPGKRTHWGFIAQEVKELVDESDVDFGGWVLTDVEDPDSKQALRYDQFIAPLTQALQESIARIESLEAEVAALKGASA